MGKRQEAALLTKHKIVGALKELLAEKSADSINIEDITEKACIAKGSFYTYFKRKEDAISVIAYKSYEVSKETVLTSNNTALQNITVYLTESAKVIEQNTLEIAQNWMKSVSAPLAAETVGADKYHYDKSTILAILKMAVEKNELKAETPVEAITQTIIDSYYGAVAVWCISKGEAKLYDSINAFCTNALSIILDNYCASDSSLERAAQSGGEAESCS